MHLFITIVGAIFAIFSIIILHELGHFVVARWCGVRVLKFSIGFGKALWHRTSRKSGTEYALGILPLGGYVKMLGEGDEVTLQEEMQHAYNCKPLWQRMAIVLAGPAVNFLLAIVAFYGAYLFGITHIKPIVGRVAPQSIVAKAGIRSGDEILQVGGDSTQNWQQVLMAVVKKTGERDQLPVVILPHNSNQAKTVVIDLSTWKLDERDPEFLHSLGLYEYELTVPPIISTVADNSAAKKAGLLPGDVILTLNGKAIKDWTPFAMWVQDHANKTATITVQRGNLRKTLSITPDAVVQDGQVYGRVGVMVKAPPIPANMIHHESFNVITAWVPAAMQTWALFKLNVLVTVKLLTGKVSLKSLGGPVTIFRYAGEATQQGLQVYLGFIAFISLTIGYLNLMPIPGLDGGHFLFQAVEAIIRRPVPERVQAVGFSVGMVFLVFLMVQATINDLIRLF